MRKYDILIAGAGPAGLSAASRLSKDFKVLIIDKNKILYTTKAWYSYEDRAKKYGLQCAVVNRCSSILFKAINEKHVMKDKCVILDPTKVLSIWMKKAIANGAEIEKNRLKGYEKKDSGIIVKTEKGNVKVRLLIDCTGVKSPILKKNNLLGRINTWLCFGAKINNIKLKDTKQIKFLPLLDSKNTYTTLYPYNNKSAEFYVFRNLEMKNIPEPSSLKELFKKTLRKKYPGAKIISPIQGNIVSGELKKYALDNVIFFGESGMLTPPAIGMGFNEILMKHERFSREVKKAMKGDLKEKNLSSIIEGLVDEKVINFQRIVANFSYYFIKSPDKWDGGVQWLNELGNMSRYWMRNELSLDWIKKAAFKLYKIIPLEEAAKYMPKQDLLFVSRQFAYFIEKSVLSEANVLIKRFFRRNSKRF